jgi:cytidylate kinase
LRRADDAIEIDSSALGPEEVVSRMAAIVDARASAAPAAS